MGPKYIVSVIIKAAMASFFFGSTTMLYVATGDVPMLILTGICGVALAWKAVFNSDFFRDRRPKYQSIDRARDPQEWVIPVL